MTKTLKQIAAEDLANLAAQEKELEFKQYQLTAKANEALQEIATEIQAIQARRQLLTDATAKGK